MEICKEENHIATVLNSDSCEAASVDMDALWLCFRLWSALDLHIWC